MNFLLQSIMIIWMGCFVPYCTGILLNCFVGQRLEKNTEIVVYGYVGVWTLFLFEATPMIMFGKTLSVLSTAWLVTCVGICIFVLVFLRKDVFMYVKKGIEMWKTKITVWKMIWFAIVLLAILSVVFVKENGTGDVVEHAIRAVYTDSLYGYDAYTGAAKMVIPNALKYSPFDMYFAVLSYMTNIHPAVMTKMICPLILIPIVYLGYQMWGDFLFEKDEKKQCTFLLVMIIINLWPLWIDKGNGFLVYSGIWQRDTILYSFILPATLLACMKEWQMNIRMGILFVCCAGAAELVFYKGLFFTILIVGISTVVILCRRKKNANNTNRD